MDHISRFGLILHMSNLDSLNHCIQDLRCQLLNGCIFTDSGVHFSALHAFGKRLYLLKHIGIEHIVVHPVGFGAFLRVRKVAHTEVNISFAIFKLLSGYLQRVPAAFAEQLSPEQIESMFKRETPIPGTNLLHTVKLDFVYNCFVGVVCDNLFLRGGQNSDAWSYSL